MTRRSLAALRHPYLLALVLPALLLNAVAITLALPVDGGGEAVVAEIEILAEDHFDALRHGRTYLARVERVVKGDPGARVLRVRFGDELLPEGRSLSSLRSGRGRVVAAGSNLFVVLRRGPECRYRVERFWRGSSPLPSLVLAAHLRTWLRPPRFARYRA